MYSFLMKIYDYKNSDVWQKSIGLAEEVYKITIQFPKSEQYGLISQIQRSAVSIPSNIAEGSRRFSEKERKPFLRIAFGSASELETQIILLKKLPFGKRINCTKAEVLLEDILKMLNKMSQK